MTTNIRQFDVGMLLIENSDSFHSNVCGDFDFQEGMFGVVLEEGVFGVILKGFWMKILAEFSLSLRVASRLVFCQGKFN